MAFATDEKVRRSRREIDGEDVYSRGEEEGREGGRTGQEEKREKHRYASKLACRIVEWAWRSICWLILGYTQGH